MGSEKRLRCWFIFWAALEITVNGSLQVLISVYHTSNLRTFINLIYVAMYLIVILVFCFVYKRMTNWMCEYHNFHYHQHRKGILSFFTISLITILLILCSNVLDT